MRSIVNQDFKDFSKFIEDFSLREITTNQDKIKTIRKAHTVFLALLTTTAELIAAPSSPNTQEFLKSYSSFGKDYLSEVISDCSEFIMCALLGMPRSAGGTLRSSIESYMKTFSASECPDILKRTSVPAVFNDASKVFFFSSDIGKHILTSLKTEYTHLNSYVHTVSVDHMFGANALGVFPRWEQENSNLIEAFIRIARFFILGVICSRKDLYVKFDHRNKQIITNALTRSQRATLMAIDN